MTRYKETRKHFQWSNEMLANIWEVGCELKTDEEMGIARSFPSSSAFLKLFNKKHPAIVKRYKTAMGKNLAPAVLYDRLHKNYYGDLDSKGRSHEHPLRHAEKNQYLSQLSLDLDSVQTHKPFSHAYKSVIKRKPKLKNKSTAVSKSSLFTKEELVLLMKTASDNNHTTLVLKLAKELANVTTS